MQHFCLPLMGTMLFHPVYMQVCKRIINRAFFRNLLFCSNSNFAESIFQTRSILINIFLGKNYILQKSMYQKKRTIRITYMTAKLQTLQEILREKINGNPQRTSLIYMEILFSDWHILIFTTCRIQRIFYRKHWYATYKKHRQSLESISIMWHQIIKKMPP